MQNEIIYRCTVPFSGDLSNTFTFHRSFTVTKTSYKSKGTMSFSYAIDSVNHLGQAHVASRHSRPLAAAGYDALRICARRQERCHHPRLAPLHRIVQRRPTRRVYAIHRRGSAALRIRNAFISDPGPDTGCWGSVTVWCGSGSADPYL
jgi:hypothetical protein